MKKKLLFAALVLLAGLTQGVRAQNYDCSAEAPSGQTLYYRVVYDQQSGERELVAILVHPGNVSSGGSSWGDYEMPIGDLIIPDSILNPSGYDDSIPVRGIQSYAFDNCTGLTSVVIPNTVRVIGEYAFYYCSSITSVTMPNTLSTVNLEYPFGGTSITFVDNAIAPFTFSGCTQLSGNITIPEGVTTISDHAFAGTSISSITWPSTVTTIGGLAFALCTNLEGTVSIPSSVTTIEGGAFLRCYKTTSINVPSTVQFTDYSYRWTEFPASTTFQFVKNISYTGSLIDSNNTYGVGAWGARTLNGYIENNVVYRNQSKRTITACDYEQTSVTLPASVDTIGFGAFLWHEGLTQVVMPEGLAMIYGNAFNSCTGLTSIDLPSTLDTILGGAFAYCSGLTEVALPASLAYLGAQVFLECGLDTLRMLGSVPPMYETNEGWWTNIDETTGDTLWVHDTSLVDVPIVVPCNAGYAYRHAAGWSACHNIIDPCGGEVVYYTITLESADPAMGRVVVNGVASAIVEEGDTVTIRAIANEGYHFLRWNDNDTNAERTVVVTSDTTFTAYFEVNDTTAGIGLVDLASAVIYAESGRVVVENAEGNVVTLYDAAGRILAIKQSNSQAIALDVPATGAYLVKVGNAPARRIVVVK
ncbi:MAG: leucine-rich repeat domain-containing protein [Bacteroidales bacterium]|nr:leucine-rich repeat domain-containing protein [Bacteroidales bacterium]